MALSLLHLICSYPLYTHFKSTFPFNQSKCKTHSLTLALTASMANCAFSYYVIAILIASTLFVTFSSPLHSRDHSAGYTSPSTLPLHGLSFAESPSRRSDDSYLDEEHGICGKLTWRDRFYYLDYVGYGIYLIHTAVSSIIIVCYHTEDVKQRYFNLLSMVMSAIPSGFIPPGQKSIWETVKICTGYIGSFVVLGADAAAYTNHSLLCFIFSLASAAGCMIMILFGKHVAAPMQIFGRVTNVASVSIMLIGFLIFPSWDYVPLEVYSAFAGAVYTLLGIIDACDTTNFVLVIVAAVARVLYGLLLLYNAHTKGIVLWGSHALYTAGTRQLIPLKERWNELVTRVNMTWKKTVTCVLRFLLAIPHYMRNLKDWIYSLTLSAAAADNNSQQPPPPEIEL